MRAARRPDRHSSCHLLSRSPFVATNSMPAVTSTKPRGGAVAIAAFSPPQECWRPGSQLDWKTAKATFTRRWRPRCLLKLNDVNASTPQGISRHWDSQLCLSCRTLSSRSSGTVEAGEFLDCGFAAGFQSGILKELPATSPSQPFSSASLMRSVRFVMISTMRSRCLGSIRNMGHLMQACSCLQGVP